MLPATAMAERHSRILSRLSDLALDLAEDAHADAKAAQTPEARAAATNSFRRVARCARQSMALEAKLARDHAQLEHWREGRETPPPDPKLDEDLNAVDLNAVDLRVAELQDAVGRVAYNTHGDSRQAREALERFDRELDDWVEAPDFLDADFDAQVLRAAKLLNLNRELAQAWPILKRPPNAPAPVGRCAGPAPEVIFTTHLHNPRRDSG